MKRWQRYWLYFVVLYSLLHLARDMFQDLGVRNFLSTVLVKPGSLELPTWWVVAGNTYVIAVLETSLAVVCLARDRFGKLGYATILGAAFMVVAWALYWFFL